MRKKISLGKFLLRSKEALLLKPFCKGALSAASGAVFSRSFGATLLSASLVLGLVFTPALAVAESSNNTITGYTTGAYVRPEAATGNRVNISDGIISGDIYGADSTSGTLTGNSVYITGTPTLNGNLIYGATSQTGAVTGNLVDIRGTVDIKNNTVAGAYSGSNSVQGNLVVIEGAALSTGGKIFGGQTLTGTASNNSVYINTTGNLTTSAISGANSTSGAVSGNIVTIDAVTSAGHISGGSSTSGAVSGNTVTINGGTFAAGGAISGGDSKSGTVSNNTVVINGGTFNSDRISGGHSESGLVTNNHVIINGGTFATGTVITAGSVKNASGTVSGNTLTIDYDSSHLNMTNAHLSGGVLDPTSRAIAAPAHNDALRSGNTLVLKTKTKVGTVTNFENYELHMQNSRDSAMLETTGTGLHLGKDANLRIYLGNKAENLGVGTRIHVFQGTLAGGNLGTSVALQGMSVVNHLTYVADSTSRFFTVTGQSAHPHSITFPEARLASFSFMNQANDLILGQGIASAFDTASKKPKEWVAFSAMSVEDSKYDTKSGTTTGNAEFDGISLVTGTSRVMPFESSQFTLGAYAEVGIGSVETSNNNSNRSIVNTNGDANYYGLGLLGRYSMNNGFYGEGFMRAGILATDLQTQDNKYNIDHDSNSWYYGAGLGVGYKLDLSEKRDMLDVYTRYMWMHLADKSEHIDSQDYNFDAIDSHQVRVGAQYNFLQNSAVSPFIGLAGQYEFDGEAGATIRGDLRTGSPDITGMTGLLELGLRFNPTDTIPTTTSINLEAYTGERKGVSATLDVTYFF